MIRRALVAAILSAALLPGLVLAYDPGVTVSLDTWTSPNGHGYVGVRAAGDWAPPPTTRERIRTEFYSDWENQGNPQAYRHAWWITVHRTTDDSVVNPGAPISTITSSTEPGIGISPSGYGDLSLFLEVGVEPVTAPARSERTVNAELTAGWRDWVDDSLSTYIRRDSIRVVRWTVDFGDGTRRVFAGGAISDRLVTTHAYEAGEFDVVATARVTGEAYAALFTPAGAPFEEIVPFTLDISNRASGVTALPIEYVPPVVTPGGSPSGSIPGSGVVAPSSDGQSALFWPRGLPCDLYVRAIVEEEGFMRSGGVVIGGATTRLVSYRYLRGHNDANGASQAGASDAASPIRIQWNTPLPGAGAYPVRVELTVETTYDDGTVRTYTGAGTIEVTVIYSAVSQ